MGKMKTGTEDKRSAKKKLDDALKTIRDCKKTMNDLIKKTK